MTVEKPWLNGKPYYCATCGLGYGEFLACEEIDCRLESEAEAQARAAKHLAKTRATPFNVPVKVIRNATPG